MRRERGASAARARRVREESEARADGASRRHERAARACGASGRREQGARACGASGASGRRERTERERVMSVRVSALTEGRRARARVSAVPGTRASVAVRVVAPRSDMANSTRRRKGTPSGRVRPARLPRQNANTPGNGGETRLSEVAGGVSTFRGGAAVASCPPGNRHRRSPSQ